MKYGRTILYIVGALFLLLLILIYGGALFMPSSYKVERSVTIDRPPETVYKKVADLREWRKWNPWSQGSDTNVYRGPKTGEGSVWEWRSKEHGNGELRIIEAEPYKRIETRIQFRDSSLTGHGVWRFERDGDDTKVSWGTSGKLGYPFGRIFAWIRDPQDLIGGDLHKGLKTLERHLEEDVPMNAAR